MKTKLKLNNDLYLKKWLSPIETKKLIKLLNGATWNLLEISVSLQEQKIEIYLDSKKV